MIIKTDSGDISQTNAKHIAFVIHAEGRNQGYSNDRIADKIISRYWPELENFDGLELGSVLSKKVGDKTYHALVCYTLDNGWEDNQDEIIKSCFDKIPVDDELIATYLFGTHSIDIENGADSRSILRGLNDSRQKVCLYSQLSIDEIIRYSNYKETKENYIVTKIEKVQEYINSDMASLALNAFAIGVGTLGCLCLGNEFQDYYSSNELAEFTVRFQDLLMVLSSLPVLKGVWDGVHNFKNLHNNLNIKKSYEHFLQKQNEESWTR